MALFTNHWPAVLILSTMAAHQSKTLSEAETALSNVIEEKNSLQADQRPFLRTPPKTMAQSRRLLTILVVGLLVTFGLATALTPKPWARVPCHDKSPNAKGTTPAPEADESSFEFLLNSVAPDSLHDLLHRYLPDTYRHGVYPSDQSAMEVLHRANAALATSLVRMARRGNTTTTKPPPTTSSTTVVITTTGPSGDAETTTVAQAVTTNTDLPLQTSTTTPSPTQSPTKGSSTSLGGTLSLSSVLAVLALANTL